MDVTSFVFGGRERALLVGDYKSYHASLTRQLRKSKNEILKAERCWALAMHIKSREQLTGAARRHVVSKLHKAAVHAQRVEGVEAEAYAASLAGASAFDKRSADHWQQSLSLLSKAHVIYTGLSQHDAAASLEPSIRYAAYQTKIPRSVPIKTVTNEQYQDERYPPQSAETATSVDWRGREAQISDAAVGQAVAALTATKSTSYDPILIAAQDAVDAVRRAIGDLTREGVQESDSRMQDLRVTDLAVQYTLISFRIGRNRVLLDKRLALTERVALLDSILQSIDSIKSLPGASRDTDFIASVEAQRSYFRALKCLAIGESHQKAGQHVNALALASVDIKTTSAKPPTSLAESSAITLHITPESFADLQKLLKTTTLRLRGLVELHRLQTTAPFDIQKFHKVELPNLVPFPPSLEPVPVKPIFLDLAWNYIDYPQQPSQDKAKEKGKRGWFGF